MSSKGAQTFFSFALTAASLFVPGLQLAVGWQIALAATTVVYGAYAARQNAKRARDAYESSLQDRKTMVRSATLARNYVYGKTRISGSIAYIREPVDAADPYFWIVIALPIAHKIRAITDIWWGDQSIGPLNSLGEATGEPFEKTYQWSHVMAINAPEPVLGLQIVDLEANNGSTEIWITGVQSIGSQGYSNNTGNDGPGVNYLPDTQWSFVNDPVTGDRTNKIAFWGVTPGQRLVINYTYGYRHRFIRVWKRLGLDNEPTVPELIDASTRSSPDRQPLGPWTAAHQGRGVPHIVLRINPDPDVFPNNLENISCVIEGKDDIYDLRTASSGYTVNSVLCSRDYAIAQCSVRPETIPTDLTVASANVCDDEIEILPTPGGSSKQARFTCNAVLSTEVEPVNNLAVLLGSCDGSAVFSAAGCDIRAGYYEVPTIELDESDIVGDYSLVPDQSTTDVFNGVRGQFMDPVQGWALHDYPPYESAFYREQDGETVVASIDLPATDDPYRAQRIAKQILHKAKASLVFTAPFRMSALEISPEQTIKLSIAAFGWDKKPFRVRGVNPTSMTVTELTLKEDGPLLYKWDFREAAGVDPAPNTSLPSIRIVPTIQDLRATTGPALVAFRPGGFMEAYALVEWSRVTDPLVLKGGHLEIWHKRAMDLAWTVHPNIDPYTDRFQVPCRRGDKLIIQIRASNGYVRGEWSLISYDAKDAPVDLLSGSNRLENGEMKYRVEGGSTAYDYWQFGGVSRPYWEMFFAGEPALQESNLGVVAVDLSAAVIDVAGQGGIPVTPGETIAARAEVIAVKTDVYLRVSFRDRNQVPLTTVLSDQAVLAVSYWDGVSQSLFETLFMSIVVPDRAVLAEFALYSIPPAAVSGIRVVFRRPWIGPLEQQSLLPAWTK